MVRDEVGPIARLEAVLFVSMMPKTRTGKVMRIIMLKIMNNEPHKKPATIEDPAAFDVIQALSLNEGFHKEVIRPDQKYNPSKK